MALLPDKILADAEIASFIERVNVTADEIVGDSKFQIPNPSLPGLGLLIKLQIRAFEKSIAASFAPIFIGKKIIQDAKERPRRFFSIINDGLDSIKTLFTNPIQFIIDEGINGPLEIFPFPVRILFGGVSKDANRLKSLIDSAQPTQGSSVLQEYNYNLVLNAVSPPAPGEAVSTASDVNSIKSISVNYQTKTTGEKAPVQFLKEGDTFSVSDGNISSTYRVSSVQPGNEFAEIFLQLIASNTQNSGDNKTISIPGFKDSGIAVSRNITLREFLTPDGRLIIPFSVLGINLPLLSKLGFEIGNFSNLKDDNPTKEFVVGLEARSGLKFNQVFTSMIDGVFPEIDWQNLSSEKSNGNVNSKEVSKEEITSLARLLQIGSQNPFFLIKIILNYVKLLLLPIQLVLGVFKSLASSITNPISLIKTVILFLTDPLKALCNIISESFLTFLRPYLEPIISPIIPYSEAVQDPNDKNRGLKPLFSDLICGTFSAKLNNYKPNPNFFALQRNNLGQTVTDQNTSIQLPFNLEENKQIPDQGEIVTNSNNPSQVTSLRISTVTNTIEDSLAYLASVQVGSVISLSVSNKYQTYLVSSKTFQQSQTGNYFEYLVQPTTQSIRSGDPAQNNTSVSPRFSATLSIDNPNKTFLFIIEKYLPLKLIERWESIKGILAITIALAVEIPLLIPAVFKSLFGIEKGTSPTLAASSSVSDVLSLLISFYIQPGGGLNNKQSEIVSGIIGNNNSNNSNGIETIFYDLSDSLSSQSKNTVIYKSNISPDVRNQFRYYQISLAKLGENVKVLLQIYYSIRDIRTPYIFKKQPVGKIYALRNGNVNILFNKYEEVGIYAAFQSFKVINNETINLYDDINLDQTLPYVKNFTGIYITGENGQFVYVQPLRDNIIRNLNFISTYILPNYFQS
jgi:hypothetical protein